MPCERHSCHGCPAAVSRRAFLATAGAAATAAIGLAGAPPLAAREPRPRIRVVYALHGETQADPDWPNKGFDFRPVMAGVNAAHARRPFAVLFLWIKSDELLKLGSEPTAMAIGHAVSLSGQGLLTFAAALGLIAAV